MDINGGDGANAGTRSDLIIQFHSIDLKGNVVNSFNCYICL